MRENTPAMKKVKELEGLLKFGNVGIVEKDIEVIVAFITRELNNAGEENIATLALLAKALKG